MGQGQRLPCPSHSKKQNREPYRLPKKKGRGTLLSNEPKTKDSIDTGQPGQEINAQIQELESQLAQVSVTGSLDTASTVSQINAQIAALKGQLGKVSLEVEAEVSTEAAEASGSKLKEILSGILGDVSGMLSEKAKNIGKRCTSVRLSNGRAAILN